MTLGDLKRLSVLLPLAEWLYDAVAPKKAKAAVSRVKGEVVAVTREGRRRAVVVAAACLADRKVALRKWPSESARRGGWAAEVGYLLKYAGEPTQNGDEAGELGRWYEASRKVALAARSIR